MKRSQLKRLPYQHLATSKLEDGRCVDEYVHIGTGQHFQVFNDSNTFRRGESESAAWGDLETLEPENRNPQFAETASAVRLKIDTALTAIATKQYLDWQFYGRPENERELLFFTNVSNTFPYIANDALIDASLIAIVERLKAEDSRRKNSLKMPELENLRPQKIALNHASKLSFSQGRIQDFFDSDCRYKDEKAPRLWRISRILEKELSQISPNSVFRTKVSTAPGTCEMIHAVLVASQIPESYVPPLEEIKPAVLENFQQYEEWMRKKEA